MTIRFVQAWNGYYPGQIVTSPNGGQSEATLVSLGYADYDLNGPGNSALPVTANVNDVTGGIILSAGDTTVLDQTPYTWATKPSASGNLGMCIRIANVGASAAGSYWISDGTYWRPVGGSVLLSAQSGSIATPISSFTGVTSSLFTPTAQPVIPAGMLIPGQSSIEIEASFRRTGANATASLNIHLGTAKTSADNTVYSFTFAATSLLDLLATPTVFVSETSRITATNWQTRGGSGNTSVTNDRTGNINTAAEMGVTFGISSANVADSFSMIGYKVRLFQ